MDNFIIGAVFLPVVTGMTIGGVLATVANMWDKHVDFVKSHCERREKTIDEMHARCARTISNK